MEQFKEILVDKMTPVVEKLNSLEVKIDSATENINASLISNAVLEREFEIHKNQQEKELAVIVASNNKNWDLTRQVNKETEAILPKIDNNEKDIDEIKKAAKAHLEVTTSLRSKVVKWGGIALGISGSLTATLSIIKLVEFLK